MGEVSNTRGDTRSDIVCLEGNGYRPSHRIDNYKADGSIGGGIAFAIVGDHENRPTDMTNIVVEDEDTDREKVL